MKKKNTYYSNELMILLNKYKTKGVSYLDALVELHDVLEMEFEELIELLPDSIIKNVKKEFLKRNYRIKDVDSHQEENKNTNILNFLVLKK